ncbi:MAG: hypothetical protein E6R13_02365 [Spirochaetes bacterium]|nr:MAG: hypothetical protein E6R13_02365 [Spirochaetota bacterium]
MFGKPVVKKITQNKELGSELTSLTNSSKSTEKTERKIDITDEFSRSFKLPSLGKFNDLDDGYLSVAPLTIGQVCDIANLYKIKTDSDRLQTLCTILNRSILNVKSEDLTLGDFDALCLHLAEISCGEPYSLEMEFKGIRLKQSIPLDDFSIIHLNTSLLQDGCDYPRVRDRIYFQHLLEQKIELSDIESSLFYYCSGNSGEEKLDCFRTRKLEFLKDLIKYQKEISFGISEEIEITNPEGKREIIKVPFDFFQYFRFYLTQIM